MLGLSRKDWLNLLPLLLVFAIVSTFRSGAAGLIDPDEPFYALTAKEMLQRHDWMTPTLFGQPQFEKPILAYWIYAALFRVFGIHEWAARLGPSLAALGTLVATAVLAKALFRRQRVVWLSAVLLGSSGFFIALSRIVLTDMFLCFFTAAAFAAFAVGWKNTSRQIVAWRIFFVLMGLGFLTKGPLGVLLPLGSVLVYAACAPQEGLASRLPWKSGLALMTLVAAPWYLAEGIRHSWFLPHFFMHENVRRFFVAEHPSMNSLFFYPLVLLFGFFPWSFLLGWAIGGQGLRVSRGLYRLRSSRIFLLVSSAVIFVFFSSASSKLSSYIFPIFPLLAVLLAEWLERIFLLVGRGHFRPSLLVKAVYFAGWIILPSLLVGSIVWYESAHALGLQVPVLATGLLCVVPCAVAWVLLLKHKVQAAFFVLVGMSVFFSMTVFGWILPKADRYFSSRAMMERFERDGFHKAEGTLLAGKMSVRGVSYYSGNPNVAVIATNPKKTFYTPHPILMIRQAEDLEKITSGHYPIYGILRPKEIRRLREMSAGRYHLEIVDANAQQSIVKLERLNFE